jgi:thioredoxin reductase (NADPH)
VSAPDRSLRHDETFPRLTDEQIARLTPCGHERALADGEVLWEQGAANVPFYVVLAGAIVILAGPAEPSVAVHEPGQFSGDVNLLSGRRAVVQARARGSTRVLEISCDRLRSLIQTDAELGEILLRAFILRRVALIAQGRGDVVLIGSRYSAGTLPLQEFLTRNGHPYRFVDVDRDSAVQEMLDHFHVGIDDVPVVICRGERVFKKPSIEELADYLGLSALQDGVVRDLVVVGAGPAGLAAAVYAASEGLDVLVVEAYAPGGQAGSSSRIENYLGFPTGISGQELAGRAFVQAEKFGAEMSVARTAVRLTCAYPLHRIELGAGAMVQTRAVIVATGAEYRKPTIADLTRFEGLGVYYGATQIEANVCGGEDVIVVGGGNSAGQAAVFLSSRALRVYMLVRGEGLKDTMSRYLIRRIEETPNIELRTHTRIEAVEGTSHVERVVSFDSRQGTRMTLPVRHLFLMTGAKPNTAWLEQCLTLDGNRFVKTGADLNADELRAARWPLGRSPFLFETSVPRIFAVGDVRANSVKRVAAAVGEGSVCVQLVHKALAE